ncbi:hypothetical protein RIF29_03702 [Crotalaria pallida]|uniref:Uncharacterized protein n=1 Tax=Crotalaria pallida TaxID=3830 RepID=A0AAN9P8T1_CROPI
MSLFSGFGLWLILKFKNGDLPWCCWIHGGSPSLTSSFSVLYNGAMIKKHNFLSAMTTNNAFEEGSEQKET